MQAPYLAEGRDEYVFYVNKPEEWEGDPDTGMEAYNLAGSYPSFIDGSLETAWDEFSYLAGFRLLRKREN